MLLLMTMLSLLFRESTNMASILRCVKIIGVYINTDRRFSIPRRIHGKSRATQVLSRNLLLAKA
jgi:hypothetical protein